MDSESHWRPLAASTIDHTLRRIPCCARVASTPKFSVCLRWITPAGTSITLKHPCMKSDALRSRSTGSIDTKPPAPTTSLQQLRELVVCKQVGGPSLLHLVLAWLIDIAMWVAVYCRDYAGGMYQCTVSHFVIVLTMSDVAALYIPRDLQHWCDVFRLTGALQVGALTVQLWMNGIDDPRWWVSALRLLFCGLRALHAFYGLCIHFDWSVTQRSISPVRASGAFRPATPSSVVSKRKPRASFVKDVIVKIFFGTHLKNLWHYCHAMPGPQGKYEEFVTGAIFALFAATVRSTHNTFGETRAEGPLTSFQAADALNFFVKIFFFERLMGTTKEFILAASEPVDAAPPSGNNNNGSTNSNVAVGSDISNGGDESTSPLTMKLQRTKRQVVKVMRWRGLWFAFMGFALAVQWPFMWTMYSEAPLPYIHAGAELSLFMKAHMRMMWRA